VGCPECNLLSVDARLHLVQLTREHFPGMANGISLLSALGVKREPAKTVRPTYVVAATADRSASPSEAIVIVKALKRGDTAKAVGYDETDQGRKRLTVDNVGTHPAGLCWRRASGERRGKQVLSTPPMGNAVSRLIR